jgi:C-terminal processing protease CtpA/Prc
MSRPLRQQWYKRRSGGLKAILYDVFRNRFAGCHAVPEWHLSTITLKMKSMKTTVKSLLLIAMLGAASAAGAQTATVWRPAPAGSSSYAQESAFAGIEIAEKSGDVVVTEVLDKYFKTPIPFVLGDVIRSVDGVKIGSKKDWNRLMKTRKPGDKVTVAVERAGKSELLQVTLERIFVFPQTI